MANIELSILGQVIIHGGIFHADDVFSVALLKTMGFGGDVVRTFKVTDEMREAAENGTSIIVDIGGEYSPEKGIFDHHQIGAPTRATGGKYAAFGLLVREYADQVWFADVDRIAEELDACDNGESPCVLSSIIHDLNPTWESVSNGDAEFKGAVEMAENMLRHVIEQAESKKRAANHVFSAPVQGGVLVLPRYAPWQDYVAELDQEVKAVVWPSNRGGYNCQIRPVEPGSFERVGDFSDEVKAGVEGCTFRHAAGFLAAFETEEEAIQAGMGVILR